MDLLPGDQFPIFGYIRGCQCRRAELIASCVTCNAGRTIFIEVKGYTITRHPFPADSRDLFHNPINKRFCVLLRKLNHGNRSHIIQLIGMSPELLLDAHILGDPVHAFQFEDFRF